MSCVTFDIDLHGSKAVDPSFLSVVVELDPDLWSGDHERMRERAAEHYGVPVAQVVPLPAPPATEREGR